MHLWYNVNSKKEKNDTTLFPMLSFFKELKCMNITITGRKFNLKDSFRDYAEQKMKKIQRIFGDDADAKITVTVEKEWQTVETTLRKDGIVYRAECSAPMMEEALDKTIDDLVRKLRKNKTRVEKKLKEVTFELPPDDNETEEEGEIRIVRNKHFPVKPMDAEEAVLQMNLIGHQFFMFRDMHSCEINVVYRRKDGNYGLLCPEN